MKTVNEVKEKKRKRSTQEIKFVVIVLHLIHEKRMTSGRIDRKTLLFFNSE